MKPFARIGGHTTFDNAILDHIMPMCKPNEWKVICFIIRKTIGWHKEKDKISLSQIRSGTGIASQETAHHAISEAITHGFIIKTREGKQGLAYALNKDYEIPTSTETVQEPVQKSNTQKKQKKLSITKEVIDSSEPEYVDIGDEFEKVNNELKFKRPIQREFVGVIAVVTAMDSSLNWSALAKIGKRLWKAGYTSEQIKSAYSPGGAWWTKDWRGKKGQRPTPGQIPQTIKNLLEQPQTLDDKVEERHKRMYGEHQEHHQIG